MHCLLQVWLENLPRTLIFHAVHWLRLLLGGLLLGYGARLAYGCNIGAYFSGIASGSVHGWLWLVFAFMGNAIGVKLRPIFFPNEKPQPEKLTGC